MALTTLCDFIGSLSCISSSNALGTICHDTPNLSFSHAHCISSASGELLPQLIHFWLRLAVYKERYGWRKSVVRAAIQRHEFLPFELESHGHHGSFRARTRFSVTGDVQDF